MASYALQTPPQVAQESHLDQKFGAQNHSELFVFMILTIAHHIPIQTMLQSHILNANVVSYNGNRGNINFSVSMKNPTSGGTLRLCIELFDLEPEQFTPP